MIAVVLAIVLLKVQAPLNNAQSSRVILKHMLSEGAPLRSCSESGTCAVQALKIVEFTAVDWQRAWGLAPVTLLYVGNVACALMGLQNLNIPMYNTLKRLTPVIVLLTKV